MARGYKLLLRQQLSCHTSLDSWCMMISYGNSVGFGVQLQVFSFFQSPSFHPWWNWINNIDAARRRHWRRFRWRTGLRPAFSQNKTIANLSVPKIIHLRYWSESRRMDTCLLNKTYTTPHALLVIFICLWVHVRNTPVGLFIVAIIWECLGYHCLISCYSSR